MSRIVNQETLIPVGLAIVIIGTAAMWISDMRNVVKAHQEQIELLSKNHEAHIKLITEINSRLSRIEWKLESK